MKTLHHILCAAAPRPSSSVRLLLLLTRGAETPGSRVPEVHQTVAHHPGQHISCNTHNIMPGYKLQNKTNQDAVQLTSCGLLSEDAAGTEQRLVRLPQALRPAHKYQHVEISRSV